MKFTAVALLTATAALASADFAKRGDDYKIDLAPHIPDECKPKCHVIVDLYNDLTTKGCKPFGKADECFKSGCASLTGLYECSQCLVNEIDSDYKGLASIAVVKGHEWAERYCKDHDFATSK